MYDVENVFGPRDDLDIPFHKMSPSQKSRSLWLSHNDCWQAGAVAASEALNARIAALEAKIAKLEAAGDAMCKSLHLIVRKLDDVTNDDLRAAVRAWGAWQEAKDAG